MYRKKKLYILRVQCDVRERNESRARAKEMETETETMKDNGNIKMAKLHAFVVVCFFLSSVVRTIFVILFRLSLSRVRKFTIILYFSFFALFT